MHTFFSEFSSKSVLKLFLACMTLVFSRSYAQNFSATAKIDTNAIVIGQQIKLTLQLTQAKNTVINWVAVPDTLSKIEIVNKSKIDTTLSVDSTSIIRSQQFTITCFDSGYYVVPPFRFVDNNNPDTLTNFAETLPLLLAVNTVAVDTTKAIRDIKGPVTVPWSLEDFLPWIIGVLGLIILLIAGYYFYQKYTRKPVLIEKEKPKRPAHEIALEELKKLEEEKIWQQGNFKFYHTRLTDIIRAYLWHRYDINAMEMTTDEVLESHSIKQVDSESVGKLKYMLELADLVKFAKVIPVVNENEQTLAYGYDFVTATKLIELKAENKKEAAS